MKLIIEENEQKMSESAMHILLGAMMQDKRVNISLTAGRSPINLYKMMVPYVKDQEKFKDIQYYLFDEAPYQDKPHGPNWEEMQELFFKDANIPDERIHTTTMENWETYDQEIRDAGGIDVMLVGMDISAATVQDVHLWIVILIQWIVKQKMQLIQHIQQEIIYQSLYQWVQKV